MTDERMVIDLPSVWGRIDVCRRDADDGELDGRIVRILAQHLAMVLMFHLGIVRSS